MGNIILSGSISIISAQYTISLCKDCRKQFHITAGEVVQWILVPKPESEQLGCTMTLQDEGDDMEVIPAGKSYVRSNCLGEGGGESLRDSIMATWGWPRGDPRVPQGERPRPRGSPRVPQGERPTRGQGERAEL